MAFSTQKEFFHVPFMNEPFEFDCAAVSMNLKTYPSTFDDRSWAADDEKKSRFIADLVACNTPFIGRRYGSKGKEGDGANADAGQGASGAKAEPRSGAQPSTRSAPCAGRDGQLVVGDSLINAADQTLGRVKELLIQNKILEKRLEESTDRLITANTQNDEIKRIMDQRYDPAKSKELRDKVKQMENEGKIKPNDAQELYKLQDPIDDMNKAYEILQAENANLKHLVDKQARRAPMESVPITPEKSTDVDYLQKKVDSLAKEVLVLREAEDDMMKGQKSGKFSPEYDVNNIKAIVGERDALRRKLQSLKELQNKMDTLEQKAYEADCLSNNLSNNVDNQTQYINDMENEMQDMQTYYEKEVEQSKFNEELLKCRCDELKQELMSAKCAAQRSECLQMEVDVLRNELRKRDVALNAYDCQYQQLMHKAKRFKNAGYRFLDDLPDSRSDSCFTGVEDEEEDEEGGECTC